MPQPHRTTPPKPAAADTKHAGSIAETLIALIISLAMAFVAKTYVIEAYRIPTGSMAPTLLGAHMRFTGPQTGHDWAVDNWHYDRVGINGTPLPVQGGRAFNPGSGRWEDRPPPAVTDPMTAPLDHPPTFNAKPGSPVPTPTDNRAGDRILVQKYLYEIAPPQRFDVAVFRNPSDADVNYIKRIVGLPREAVWLADGDVFTTPLTPQQLPSSNGVPPASLAPAAPGDETDQRWRIRRKPLNVQRRVWRPVFHSNLAPIDPTTTLGDRYFNTPWLAQDGDWTLQDTPVYTLNSQNGSIAWDHDRWPITDMIPFNENLRVDARGPNRTAASAVRYPVADLRLRFTIVPDATNTEPAAATCTLDARQHRFTIAIAADTATLTITGPQGDTVDTVSAPAPPIAPGDATTIDIWHADQALSLFINDHAVIRQHPYGLGPAQRILHATGLNIADIPTTDDRDTPNSLANPRTYRNAAPRITLAIQNGPATLRRVQLDKDLHYRPLVNAGTTGLAVHPDRPAILGSDQFFVLGDNSAASLDSRAWERVDLDPWVARALREWADDPAAPPTVGVVPRRLLLGRAFFVYWPAAYQPLKDLGIPMLKSIPVPDFGRMRFIY